MTDAKVICTWMEPRPAEPPCQRDKARVRWWATIFDGKPERWAPIPLDLDALHEVEARLTNEQWGEYANLMMDPEGVRRTWFLLHASAEQKIAALAAVLRPIVEATHAR